MHDSYHMTSKYITRESFVEEVLALVSRRHVDKLNRLKYHHITDAVVLDVDTPRTLMMHWVHGKLTT